MKQFTANTAAEFIVWAGIRRRAAWRTRTPRRLVIDTPEGKQRVMLGDWVIRDEAGHLHRRPPVVTICGSMRFYERMLEVAAELTGQGIIVQAPHQVLTGAAQDTAAKRRLDALHRRKIDLSDRIVVVTDDTTRYHGESTRAEIAYATALGIPVEWAARPPAGTPADDVIPAPDRHRYWDAFHAARELLGIRVGDLYVVHDSHCVDRTTTGPVATAITVTPWAGADMMALTEAVEHGRPYGREVIRATVECGGEPYGITITGGPEDLAAVQTALTWFNAAAATERDRELYRALYRQLTAALTGRQVSRT